MSDNRSKFPKNIKPNSVTILLVGLLLWATVFSFVMPYISGQSVTEVKYNEFWKMLESGDVTDVVLNDPITFTAKDSKGEKRKYETPYKSYGYDDELLPTLKEHKNISYTTKSSNFFVDFILPNALYFGLLLGVMFLLSRSLTKRMGGNSMSFGKSNAKVYVQSKTGKNFIDVAGQDEAKEDLTEIVDFLHDPKKI